MPTLNTFNNGETLDVVRNTINNNFVALENKVYDKAFVALAKTTDVGDTANILSGDIGLYKLFPLNLTTVSINDFVAVTNGVMFTGETSTTLLFNAKTSVSVSVDAVVLKLRVAVNGVTKVETTSSVKLGTITDLANINITSAITVVPNDIITIHISTDKACTATAQHTQITLLEV